MNDTDMSNTISGVLEKANEALKNAAEAVVDNANTVIDVMTDRINRAKIDLDTKKLRPIMPSELNSESFSLPKIIRIVEQDIRHEESPACKGSIGHLEEHKQLLVAYLYPDTVEQFGLEFFPDKDSELYYVDPINSRHYIALDDYFTQLKTARVNELQEIAQDLGAKHFRVVYREQERALTAKKLNAKASVPKKTNVDAGHETKFTQADYMEISAQLDFPEGHGPIEPKLHYLANDTSVKTLIKIRMNQDHPVKHQKCTLKLSNSSGMKEKDALRIDAALASMKLTGNVTVVSEFQNEARRFFEYEIDY